MKRGSYRTGRERVERILDSAHQLFISAGYRATSLREIAAASGISHPALLRHFSSKEEILTALVDRLDREHDDWLTLDPDTVTTLPTAAEVALRSEAAPGWIPLFTALLGEATSPEHPGHELMRDRRRIGTRLGVRLLGGWGGDERSVRLAVQRLGAAWDGLQILSLYFPGRIDIPARLAAYEEELRTHGIPAAPRAASASAGAATPDAAPPPPDAARALPPDATPRSRAVEAAARLYARHGYHATSMAAVAEAAGLTKAALVHVAPTKGALLDLVVAELFAPAPDEADPGSRLRALLGRPRWQAAAEIVLMCEATVPSHPAHAQLAARLERGLALAECDLVARGLTPEEMRVGAQWMLALVLGGLIAWLYEPEAVELDVLIQGALPPEPGAAAGAAAGGGALFR